MVVKDKEDERENLREGCVTSTGCGSARDPVLPTADRDGNRLLGQLPLVRLPFYDYRAR